ncbi:MAG: 30S ribosomal protein S17 [Nanoarchaeota archaeon]
MEKEKTIKQEKGKKIVETPNNICNDVDCHIHGNLKARGKTFEGTVIKKFPKRIVIEFERSIYVKKYERYSKSRTRIHARLPKCMEDSMKIGDYIKVQECRPLSKIIHFVAIEKIKDAQDKLNLRDKGK